MFFKNYITLFTLLILALNGWSQTNLPPTITATGDQFYCPLSQINIALDFNIIDPDNTLIDAVFIQISTGYTQGEDVLKYLGTNSNINSSWSSSEGKLTLKLPTAVSVYTDLIAAVKEVVFESNANSVSGEKFFSFTIDAANYLPSTGHYYEYISDVGITWDAAKIAAETKTFYGLQGYLATISSTEEAQLSGEQASGAGWIGGSDAATEGIWKWVTGPENGTVFWNGNASGSSPNFAFWNTGEPNNSGDENYAHVTDPTIGIPGSWNDLKITGDPPGPYHPKGYIVEYGGMPGDPILNISASTKITATIVDMTIVDDSENNSIAVNITGTGDYEIALDDLNDFNPFVANSSLPGRTHLFSNVTAGIHKVFIKDKNGCGLTIKDAIVIGFPHFLTPNGDGINDTWNVAGASLQPNSLIYIFDRFGKLIAKVDPTGPGWEGTFNGRKLPSNDYWFTARLQDGRIRKGHFSLVRR
jgi:gliding motility-associated-like protein